MSSQFIETKEIEHIQFGLMSPEFIREMAVVQIISDSTIDNGKPVDGGLFDLKMGSIENNQICTTCQQLPRTCPGHFGYLELKAPIFHPEYIDVIKKVLETICFTCYRIIIDDTAAAKVRNMKVNSRLEKVKDLIKTKKICPHCNSLQPTIKKQTNVYKLTYYYENDTEKDNNLTPYLIREILKHIKPEDALTVGFSELNRPEWMVLEVLPIPPPSVRPTVLSDSNTRGEDDLTVLLTRIIQTNNRLGIKLDNPSSPPTHIAALTEELTFIIYAALSGGGGKTESLREQKLIMRSTGKPLKSLGERLKGKGGRIRLNLVAKRVNYSARSVISPDPNLDLDILGVPRRAAEILTVPVYVNKFNIDELTRLVQNRTNEYPSAIMIVQNDQIRTLKYIKNIEEIVLKIGDVVVRQLMDGDVILFNRQPTLHKMSMMAFKAKIMNVGNTFRINLSCTTPYNADFDGDKHLVPNRWLLVW